MELPRIFPITSEIDSLEKILISLPLLLQKNISSFLYRRKNLNSKIVDKELFILESICSKLNISLFINSHHEKDTSIFFTGMHLTQQDLKKLKKREIDKTKLLGASCHCLEDIKKAEILEVDYIFLSPVKRTESKINYLPLGWKKFSSLCNETTLPVYALGGMQEKDLPEAQKKGAYGIAGISRFWSD